MADLHIIQFNSWRDPQGYRLDDQKQFVVRNGKRNDNFEALEPLKNKALNYEFANTVVTPESLLKFVQTYGPLTERGNDQGDEVHDVLWHAERMRDLLKLWHAERRRDLLKSNSARGRTGRPTKRFGLPLTPLFAGISWDPKTNSLRWVMQPHSLLDGLWLQFGQATTRGARIETCRRCGEWFEVGYPSDRRLDAKFCCDDHRVKYNSLNRSKGE